MVPSFWKSQWSLTNIAATKSPKGFNEPSQVVEDQAEVGHATIVLPHVLNRQDRHTAHGKRAEKRIGEVANAPKHLLDLSGSGGKGSESAQTTRQIGSAQRTIYPSVPLRTSWDRLIFVMS
jgi:hypothetical protein